MPMAEAMRPAMLSALLQEAREALADGNVEEAKQKNRTVLDLEPGNAEAAKVTAAIKKAEAAQKRRGGRKKR